MDIREIPKIVVVIDINDDDNYSKFIVAQITNGKDSRLVVRINENYNHHKNILAFLKKK